MHSPGASCLHIKTQREQSFFFNLFAHTHTHTYIYICIIHFPGTLISWQNIQVLVAGTESDNEARILAKSIISSNLVKSAIFGADPNWGRIACAAGYSGVEFDPNALSISLGDEIVLMQSGQPVEFDVQEASGYLQKQAASHSTVDIVVSVGSGCGRGFAWGCDLSYDYVRINAEYTT